MRKLARRISFIMKSANFFVVLLLMILSGITSVYILAKGQTIHFYNIIGFIFFAILYIYFLNIALQKTADKISKHQNNVAFKAIKDIIYDDPYVYISNNENNADYLYFNLDKDNNLCFYRRKESGEMELLEKSKEYLAFAKDYVKDSCNYERYLKK